MWDVEVEILGMTATQCHKGEGKIIMPVLKSPPTLPRSATIQVRVVEEINLRLRKYAEFINGSPTYVVSESLRLLFSKDHEFREWLTHHGDEESPLQLQGKASAAYVKGS